VQPELCGQIPRIGRDQRVRADKEVIGHQERGPALRVGAAYVDVRIVELAWRLDVAWLPDGST
jgi:hypothetical protein